MSEYAMASGPGSAQGTQPVAPLDPVIEEERRRAELFLQLPSLFSADQPLEDVLSTIARTIVEHTNAVSAAVALVRPEDASTIALGYHNLPPGYQAGMQSVRQSDFHTQWLRDCAREDRTWVVRQAREFMLGREEYAHMLDEVRGLPFDTLIGTPFLNRPDSLGFVYLYYADDVGVDEQETEFARELARYARPLMDNAWLYHEAQRRTAELEALSRADQLLHESILLADVYQATIDLAVDLFGADRSLFLTFDDSGRFHAAAARGVPPHQLEGLQKVYHAIPRSRFAGRDREPSVVEDVANEPRVVPGVRENTNSASSVDIPVFVGGEFYGMFVLGYHKKRTFNGDDRRLFRTLAARAGLAMQNALQFKASQQRTAELEALGRADQALHTSLKHQDVYQAMTDLSVDLFGADRSMLLTWDESDRLHPFAARGMGEAQLAGLQEMYHTITRSDYQGLQREVLVFEDVANDDRVNPVVRRLDPPASAVDIPVYLGDEFFASFVLGYDTRRQFSDEDRRLFGTFAARAALAIQNARTYGETRRRTSELEALSNVDAAIHQSLVLQDIYKEMLDLAVDVFGADHSLFLTFNEAGIFHAAASRGVPPEHLAGLQPIYAAMPRATFHDGRREVVVVEDIQSDPHLRPGILEFTRSRSTVDINVFVGGEFFGMFVLGYHTKRTFDDGDRRLFGTLSARASLAIQNAVLYGEAERRANELEALYRADQALHTSLRLEDVLKAMVALAVELLGATSSLVVTWDENDRLAIRETTGVRPDQREHINARYQEVTRERLSHYERPYRMALIEDVNSHPKINFDPKYENPNSLAEIPVVVADELWGYFSIGWKTARSFSDADRRMFDAFASRASLAIQNALLFEQAQKSASMEERSRIARELHDSVSQALYGIGLGARTARRRLGDGAAPEVLEPVEYIVQLAESGLAETRALIFELVPESLEEQGLVLALQRQAAATQARYRVQVAAFLDDEPEIPIRAKEALYRIAQESLHNMAKHAQAASASLTLAAADGLVRLTVKDDGKGFDTSGEFPGHFGLRSMEERARRIGGVYAIESAPGMGTTVTVSVPLAVASAGAPGT